MQRKQPVCGTLPPAAQKLLHAYFRIIVKACHLCYIKIVHCAIFLKVYNKALGYFSADFLFKAPYPRQNHLLINFNGSGSSSFN